MYSPHDHPIRFRPTAAPGWLAQRLGAGWVGCLGGLARKARLNNRLAALV